jgi:ABC-type multidrug transport system fused ATPase/permease subunit
MLVRCGVFIVATIVVLFILSPILAATTFVGIVPIVTFSIKFGFVMKDFGKAISAEKAKMSTIADESLNNVRIVKAFCTEEDEIKKFTEYSTNVYKIGLKKAYWTGFFGFFVQLCLYGAMALIIYIASILYERDMITIGRITSFLFYMIMLLF